MIYQDLENMINEDYYLETSTKSKMLDNMRKLKEGNDV